MRRAVVTIGAAVAAAALAAVAVFAVRGAAAPDPIEITNATVAQGHVLDAAGEPVAGAEVYAELWPANDAEFGDGDVVPWHEVGTTRTDDAGRFAFVLDPATVPAGFRNVGDDDAWVQLHVGVADPHAQASWGLPALTAVDWAAPGPGTTRPAWSLRTDEGDLPPSRVDIVLVVRGDSRVRVLPR
ncbi:hypothetical protein [Catellatospora sp. NPDC049609]|uniref:hypothetical protein n=1 Tax=Catellatospora sp. NPDC049609 TaxID=3155505 RepID=UPI00343841DC